MFRGRFVCNMACKPVSKPCGLRAAVLRYRVVQDLVFGRYFNDVKHQTQADNLCKSAFLQIRWRSSITIADVFTLCGVRLAGDSYHGQGHICKSSSQQELGARYLFE